MWEVIYRRKNGDRLWFDGTNYAVSDGTYPTECEVVGIPGVLYGPYIIDIECAKKNGVLLLRSEKAPSSYYRVAGLIGGQFVQHPLCIEAAVLLAKRIGVGLELEIDGVRFALKE